MREIDHEDSNIPLSYLNVYPLLLFYCLSRGVCQLVFSLPRGCLIAPAEVIARLFAYLLVVPMLVSICVRQLAPIMADCNRVIASVFGCLFA